jgi:glucan phosphoethanolaminetransferase (alkaline phosphatase superfamily)
MIGSANAVRFIDELTGFFLHMGQLNGNWTAKERFHLLEVRGILDVAACIAGICILLLIVTYNRSILPFYSTVNLLIILSLLILLPFFKFFWVKIFHPLFFSNNLWLNNSFDRSFYIMPGVFFKHSLIFLVSSAALLNGFVRVFARKR